MQKLLVILVVIKLYSRIDILKICEILKKNAVEKISFGQKKMLLLPFEILQWYSEPKLCRICEGKFSLIVRNYSRKSP